MVIPLGHQSLAETFESELKHLMSYWQYFVREDLPLRIPLDLQQVLKAIGEYSYVRG
jgi:hypothetical protein